MKKVSTSFALAVVIMIGSTPIASAARCFEAYQNNVLNCSYLDQPDQTFCNLDAAVELTGCVRHSIF